MTPDNKRFSVEFVKMLSMRVGLQPGISWVAIEIVGIMFLAYINCSKSEEDDRRSILKSPTTYLFSVGNSFKSASLRAYLNGVFAGLKHT